MAFMTTLPPPELVVRHVLLVLSCDDVVRAKGFYVRAFGWEVKVDLPIYVEMAVPTGLRVGLYARDLYAGNTGEPPTSAPPIGTTACELYLRVDDPRPALDRLVAAGGRLLTPVAPRPWGDEAGYVADPEGNVVAVSRPLDSTTP
jgi:predicted enzyme related to lactoylglutathione lyase